MTRTSYQRIFVTCSISVSVLLEIMVRRWDLWLTIPFCDKIMHLLWGLNIFLILSGFLRWTPKAAVTGVLAWQLIWELSEMIGDHLLPNQPVYMLDLFYHDGIIDTVVDLAGAMLGCLIVHRMSGIRGEKRVFPQGSLGLLLGCFATMSLMGPVIAPRLEWDANHFAIACILLTMIIYMAFLLYVNQRIRMSVPVWTVRLVQHAKGSPVTRWKRLFVKGRVATQLASVSPLVRTDGPGRRWQRHRPKPPWMPSSPA